MSLALALGIAPLISEVKGRGGEQGLWSQTAWFGSRTVPLPSWVIPSKLLNFSMPQLSPL